MLIKIGFRVSHLFAAASAQPVCLSVTAHRSVSLSPGVHPILPEVFGCVVSELSLVLQSVD